MYKLHYLIITISLFTSILPSYIYGIQTYSAENEKTLRIAFTEQEYTLNFIHEYNHIELAIHTGIYSGLLTSNPTTLQPDVGLAVSWFVNDTQDTFIFNLRNDAKFSDGSPITAQDVKDSWIAAIKAHNAFTYLFELIEGVSEYTEGTGSLEDIQILVNSDKILKVKLKEPAPYFLSTVTHPAFSVSSSEQVLKENWDDAPLDIIFSGPFVIKSSDEKLLVLEKNENFWDKNSVYFENIEIHFYDDKEAEHIIEDVNTGKIHWSTFYREPDVVAKDDNSPNIQLEDENWLLVHPIFGSEYLFFSDTQNTPWSDPKVRKAIKLLLPLEEIKNNYRFSTDNLVPQITGVYEPNFETTKQNIEQAHKLLAEAGYPDGNGLEEIIILATEYQDGSHREIFDTIINAINTELSGTKAVLKTIPLSNYQEAFENSKFTIALTGWIGDFADPAAFLQIWASPNPSLGHNYNNPQYQEIISQSNLLQNEERIFTLIEAEQMLLDESVVIPLRKLIGVNIVRSDMLQGWSTNILDIHLLGALYFRENNNIPRLSYISPEQQHENYSTQINY